MRKPHPLFIGPGLMMLCAVIALSVALTTSAAARPSGAYLHLREANALARKVQSKMGGHTALSPCTRVDAQHAACKLVSRSADTYCTFTVHVSKARVGRAVRWDAKTGKAQDCEYVG